MGAIAGRSTWLAVPIAGVLAALVVPAACQSATQVTVVVSADATTCASLRDLAISVGADPAGAESKVAEGFYATTTALRCDGSGEIGTLVVTPSDEGGRGAIVVTAGIGTTRADSCRPSNGYAGCIVARRAFSFREHEKLVLPIEIVIDCLNVPCDAQSSCKSARCVSSETTCQGSSCSDFGSAPDGTEVVVDASTSNDATAEVDGAPAIDGAAPSCAVRGQPIACGVEACTGKPCCTAWVSGSGGSSGSSGTSGTGSSSGGGPTFDSTFRCRESCSQYASRPQVTILTCRSSRECAPGFKCCGHTNAQMGPARTDCIPEGTECASLGPRYGDVPFVACAADCDCPTSSCGAATPIADSGVRACVERW
ncbi:MAG: hypothetical protein KF795_31350 [Labilithrix sp.]|nr:hypothetical protein [Labilithrix sp.]